MKTYTQAEAFAYFGTKKSNSRKSHCATSPERKRLAITCWQDRLRFETSKVTYEDRAKESWAGRELLRELKYANENLNGEFHVVEALSEDPKDGPRKIKECYPRKFIMRLIHLDTETGCFKAESKAA